MQRQGKVRCANPSCGALTDAPLTVWLPDPAALASTQADSCGRRRAPTFQRTPWAHERQQEQQQAEQQHPPALPAAGPRGSPDAGGGVVTGASSLLLRPGPSGPRLVLFEGPGSGGHSAAAVTAALAAGSPHIDAGVAPLVPPAVAGPSSLLQARQPAELPAEGQHQNPQPQQPQQPQEEKQQQVGEGRVLVALSSTIYG
jgi:hypothetical protein